MKKLSEIESLVDNILSTDWKTRQGTVVPQSENVQLGNDAVQLDATVLYADLAESTNLVQSHKDWFAAEVYKVYLLCAAELIKNNGGEITAFDGDRIMAVFIGINKNSAAAKCALQINHLVSKVINPKIKSRYPTTSYVLKQAVGIDTSKLFVAKTGVRGANDLVWVGRAANYAAKLCNIRDGVYSSYITAEVYKLLNEASKFAGEPKKDMWIKFVWADTGIIAYKSNYSWAPN